jgi:hypothetical protein
MRTRHERGRFFVADLDEAHPILPDADRFHDAVDAVPRKSEDAVNAPADQSVDENVRCVRAHVILLESVSERAVKA